MKNWTNEKNLNDLHKRLASVLPEYPLMSTYKGKSGVYKAINGQGDVFLVKWTIEEGQPAQREETLAMDYKQLLAKSAETMGRYAPDQGWNLDDDVI